MKKYKIGDKIVDIEGDLGTVVGYEENDYVIEYRVSGITFTGVYEENFIVKKEEGK